MVKPLQDSPADLGVVFWPTTLFVHLLKAQQDQWQSLIAWQHTVADLQQDLYDRWTSQCASAARLGD